MLCLLGAVAGSWSLVIVVTVIVCLARCATLLLLLVGVILSGGVPTCSV